VSVDGIPIIDTVPSAKNVVVGTGWSGYGYAISVAVNRLVADWVCNGTEPELLKPFTYERFHELVE
jgi:sarcosine oxidase subunit beta